MSRGNRSIKRTASQTTDREYQYHHNIEVNENDAAKLGVGEGDKVVAKNHREPPYPACHGRIHLVDNLEDGEVGLGYTLRYATGTPEGEEVTLEPFTKEPQSKSALSIVGDRIFGKRPVICRVRMAVEPDPGFRVCRISDETKELLGISYGDRVVIESQSGTAGGVKALPQKGRPEEIKEKQKTENPDRYPSCFDEVNIEGVRETKIDIPEIYIDRDLRDSVGIIDNTIPAEEREATDEGVCQPVVVYRDTTGLFGRVFLEIATPLVIGAVVAAVGFETELLRQAFELGTMRILYGKLALLLVALLIVVTAVWYQTRIVLLD